MFLDDMTDDQKMMVVSAMFGLDAFLHVVIIIGIIATYRKCKK